MDIVKLKKLAFKERIRRIWKVNLKFRWSNPLNNVCDCFIPLRYYQRENRSTYLSGSK